MVADFSEIRVKRTQLMHIFVAAFVEYTYQQVGVDRNICLLSRS